MNSKNSKYDEGIGHAPKVGFPSQRPQEVARGHSLMIPIVAIVLAALAVEPSSVLAAKGTTPGSYLLSCFMEPVTGQQPCRTGNEIPLGTALVLDAQVTDSSGNPAKRGALIFQDCLLNGVPAPSIQCDAGSGNWSNIERLRIPDPSVVGWRIGYGSPSTPTTIGFRFRYLGPGSGIANGISNSMDVTWF